MAEHKIYLNWSSVVDTSKTAFIRHEDYAVEAGAATLVDNETGATQEVTIGTITNKLVSGLDASDESMDKSADVIADVQSNLGLELNDNINVIEFAI